MNKKYLIIPSVPTPNGRLHLGHIGGPYLRADMLARYLRLSSHEAVVISGTDSYESYVTAQAVKEKLSPEEVCHYYHPLIEDDFNTMNIKLDCFVNPLASAWKTSYQDWHQKIFQYLINNKVTTQISESVAFDMEKQRYLTGCWLHGNCPNCRANVAGYFCEDCGAHFRPEEVLTEDHAFIKMVKNVFLHLPPSVDLKDKGINSAIENTFQKFLKQQYHLFRLTANSDWGLPHEQNNTLFNYGLMFAYFLMFGEIAGRYLKIGKNAFALDSSVITIASFGIDNAVPFLSSSLGITAAYDEYKPFDYYLVNYFYHLNGKKFSTSRRHAIWVNDVAQCAKISSDIVRLYLSSIAVHQQSGNFIAHEFMQFYNQTVDWIEHFIYKAIRLIPEIKTQPMNANLIEKINNLFKKQEQIFSPDIFLPHEMHYLINEWLEIGKELDVMSEDYFWWLKGFILFIYPIMPSLSEEVWFALGYSSSPVKNHFLTHPVHSLRRELVINMTKINHPFWEENVAR